MRRLAFLLSLLSLAPAAPVCFAQSSSSLLESVKRDPNEARALCGRFRTLNQQGISATSDPAIKTLARERGLTERDAEILAVYVIGLHCSDVS